MSKRARGVGKMIALQPSPFHYNEWEAAEPHRHEVHTLLAPVLVRTDAMATCGLMMLHSNWYNALKPEVLKYMKTFNELFKNAQEAQLELHRLHPVSRQTAINAVVRSPDAPPMADLIQNEEHPLVNNKLREMQERVRTLRDIVTTFKEHGSAFRDTTVDHTLKVAGFTMEQNQDPRQSHLYPNATPAVYTGVGLSRKPNAYMLGDETIHAYAAMAFRRCEVCGPIGRKECCSGRFQGGFAPAPYAHGVSPKCFRLLYCQPECVAAQCIAYNSIGVEPLKILEGRQQLLGVWGVKKENNKLLESALRHLQVPVPIRCDALTQRLAECDHALITKRGVHLPDMPGSSTANALVHGSVVASHVDERTHRIFWLQNHPTLPPDYAMEFKLRLSQRSFALARDDLKRAQARDAEIKKAVLEANRRKLKGDIEALLSARSGLRMADLTSIDTLDAFFPGVAATAERMLSSYNEGETEHALDIHFTTSFVNVLEMMAVDMRRHDQMFSEGGRVASGRAYSWMAGMSIGETPGVGLTDIAPKLNNDPINYTYTINQWQDYITATHIFDSLTWNKLTVWKKPPSAAGSSREPICAIGSLTYSVGIGVGTTEIAIQSEVTYPSTRAEWVRIASAAFELLEKHDLEAPLPAVPSQNQINELFECDSTSTAEMAINWIEVMAQTLAYWPTTRAMGLDILTNSSTRGFVQAVANSAVDLGMLDLAKALKMADGEPME